MERIIYILVCGLIIVFLLVILAHAAGVAT